MSQTNAAGLNHADYAARSLATQKYILDTAVRVLIEFGYSGTSTLKIQERAGVSRGRLLHQYPNRDALLVAAVQHIAKARIQATRGRTDWPTSLGERSDAAVAMMWSTYHQGYFWAATELWLASRHNSALAAALRPREHALGNAIRAAIDEMFGEELAGRPRYAATRELLNTSMRGVALSYAFDRRDPAVDPHLDAWKALARRELEIPS